jgi:hypothetical protein
MDDMIYNIVKKNNVIGKGSFGKVYYHPESYPNYIVKKMKKYNNSGNNFILNNLKELWWYSLISKYDLNINNNSIDINNITNINFSNIPKMLNYNINSDYIYILIEYKGSTIYSLIKEVRENKKQEKEQEKGKEQNVYLTEKHIELLKIIPLIIYSCSKIFMQLHYANIRHGDITFSNIMYNKNEKDLLKRVSIIDWGSLVFSKLILNNYNQCATEFMAPELDNDNTDEIDFINEIPSIKSDIFSLGVVILYILDPNKYFSLQFEKYIKDSIMVDNQYEILDDIIKEIIKKYQHNNIEQYVNKRIFYLLEKMLDTNINTRIDIDSLYMDELFTKYREQELNFDKYFLKNILRKREPVETDNLKNIIIDQTYNYLKKFKARIIKNSRNSKYKLLDTRVILMPSLQLFYTYLNKMFKLNKNEVNISCLDNLTCLKYTHCERLTSSENDNTLKNLNHYIISFLSCIKWIDTISNDDITIFHLYEYYTHLYNLLSKSFTQSILLDLLNFGTYFDLTFYNVFKKMDGNILTYPYFMDFKYNYLNHSDIKKILMNSEKL